MGETEGFDSDRPPPSPSPYPQVNPFRDRICRVFSHDNVFSFEDVLSMASVFSEQACPSLKIEYAFRIYGEYSGRRGGVGALRGEIVRALQSLSYLEPSSISSLMGW